MELQGIFILAGLRQQRGIDAEEGLGVLVLKQEGLVLLIEIGTVRIYFDHSSSYSVTIWAETCSPKRCPSLNMEDAS